MAARPGRDHSLAVKLIEAKAGEPFLKAIRRRRKQGQSYRQIAREFDVHAMTILRQYRARGGDQTHVPAA